MRFLERAGVVEPASHPDGRIKAVRLTARGRRALGEARALEGRRIEQRVER